MPTFDASNAQCHVFTYKEGLMAAIAHDLKIVVSQWTLEVDVDAGTCRGSFSSDSLQVVCAMKDGTPNPGAGGVDKRKIEKNIYKDVLNVRKHPTVTFESTSLQPAADGYSVSGKLTINGVTRPISAMVSHDASAKRYTTTVQLDQPDFGIKPYSAMLGALKIRPDLKVVLEVPSAGVEA